MMREFGRCVGGCECVIVRVYVHIDDLHMFYDAR